MKRETGEDAIMHEIRRYHKGIIDGNKPDAEKIRLLRHLEIMLHSAIVVVGGEAERIEASTRRRNK